MNSRISKITGASQWKDAKLDWDDEPNV